MKCPMVYKKEKTETIWAFDLTFKKQILHR